LKIYANNGYVFSISPASMIAVFVTDLLMIFIGSIFPPDLIALIVMRRGITG